MTRPKEASARVAYRVFFSTQLMEGGSRGTGKLQAGMRVLATFFEQHTDDSF
jgi:hypothetical protein